MIALIVGGGIGGLATALSLHEVGIEARVFESVETIRPLGVGINSNGASLAVLDAEALAASLAETPDVASALWQYESQRLPPTAAVVRSNRQMGPEVVMQMAEERAPQGFRNLDDVISQSELEEVASRYKAVAGFDRNSLDRAGRSVTTTGSPGRAGAHPGE